MRAASVANCPGSGTGRKRTAPGVIRALCLSALVLLASACVPEAEVETKPCPCGDGWQCCAGDNVCVPPGQICPNGDGPVAEDEVVVQGRVCTSTAAELAHPVKILVMVDASGSMQFTDPSSRNTRTQYGSGPPLYSTNAVASCIKACEGTGRSSVQCSKLCQNSSSPARQQAAQRLYDKHKDNPAVSFAFVRFNSRVLVNGGASAQTAGFTTDTSEILASISSLSQAELTTDYESALITARQLLERDLKAASAARRARTRYVVMFLSDGAPSITCQAGCNNDSGTTGLGGGLAMESLCDVPRDSWCQQVNVSVPSLCKDMKDNWYPHLKPCAEFNTDKRVLDQVDAIIKLKDLYGAGGISFNTTFLSDPTLPAGILKLMGLEISSNTSCTTHADCPDADERCVLYTPAGETKPVQRCKEPSERRLIKMAERGNGRFVLYDSPTKLDYLVFDYSSLFRTYGMTSLIVTNTTARPSQRKLRPDSDGDGLTDAVEQAGGGGSSATSADTDDDGYNDKLERELASKGYDPARPAPPLLACTGKARLDADGDGLNACEESALGTDPLLADSDRDRLPDGLELRWGTDPTVADDTTDDDLDGKLAGDEILAHTDPTLADKDYRSRFRYHYVVNQVSSADADSRCFQFKVRGVRLRTPLSAGGAAAGENVIRVYFGEAPGDVPQDFGHFKAATVKASYLGDGTKSPASSAITLAPSDFVSLGAAAK